MAAPPICARCSSKGEGIADVVLGSRFPKMLCLNEDQLKEHMAGNEAMKRNKDEVSRLCTSKANCSWD